MYNDKDVQYNLNIINMTEESILPPSALQKHSCCSVHLKPLLERINSLEQKLLIQTERRENEYNELLHILLTVKRNKKDENSPGKSNITIAKPISKVIVTNQHLKKKNKEANGTLNTEVKASKEKSVKKTNKTLRRSSENFKKIQITIPAQPVQKKVIKDEQLAQILEKHGDQIDKLKELTNYLMQQLFMLFQKIRQVEAGSLQMTSPKTIPTQQTINSMVFDASQKQMMMKNEQMVIQNQLLEQKVNKLQCLMMDNSHALHEQHAKISEHENMIAQLIALTRGLSNRIVQIPLYMNSSFENQPKKA